MSALPDFHMNVEGKYYGGAYYHDAEYRVRMSLDPVDGVQMNVEDSAGNPVAKPLVLDEALIEGIRWMASTDHGLDGYVDDWTLPAGMDRQIVWTLQTNVSHHVVLNEGQIDEIAAWLRFATGEREWDGGEDWEF